MKTQQWYAVLRKPSWSPPASVFGPVWTVLYVIIAVSYGYVAYLYFTHKIPFIVLLPFLLNLGFNFAYTPIQFGLRNNTLAAADILLILGTLIWALLAIWPHVRWVAVANLPYLAWVCFATVLQLTITFLNR